MARGPVRRPAPALLTTLLLTAVLGCGTRHTAQAPAGTRSEGESPAEVTEVASTQMPAAGMHGRRPAVRIHQITMSDRRCIRFDPQWTTVRVGQSITWHSELKTPMTIYVSPGVFSSVSYFVQPGATVTTGPARAAGRYAFWTEPAACQEMPRGVLLSGPGVRVQETFYASTGPR
jgi:plastocyanin